MSNELTVKNVGFCGGDLLAIQECETGKIFAGINSILRELGFDERQIEYRRNKWNADKVISKGVRKFLYPSKDGGNQETYCIEIKRLPIALAKIEITPKMENEMPELSSKLEQYQEECADVLAAAFLPQPHNVKVLTVTSRDVCKMLGHSRQSHAIILREIRECIVELEEMGFNRLDFFVDSTYPSSHSGMQPQFLCTERGCEYFSGRLEPTDRRIFISEFKDRFRRLQGVLDGKPVRDVVQLNTRSERETVFRLYQNNQWGILVLDDEVYNLTPEEMNFISNMVPCLDKNGVRQIKTVIQTYLENSRKGGKLEKIGEYHCLNGEITEIPTLQEVATSGKVRRLKVDESRSLDEVVNLTIPDAQTRYRMSRRNILKIVDEIGALVSPGGRGKAMLLDRKKLDEYFNSISS